MSTMPGRIIKSSAVRRAPASGQEAATAAAAPGATCGHDGAVEPTINLHREGDSIVAIEVICGCGRTTVLECDYGEEDAS